MKLTIETLEAAAKSRLKSQMLLKWLILDLKLPETSVPWLDADECSVCAEHSSSVSKRFIITQLCEGCDK